jgi:hypothetical protein
MPVPRSVAFAVVTALLPVAGCVETPPGPLPQATPSWSCTPVAGGTPYACYEHQYQQTSAQNKLYEEAEAVYRKFNAEDERIYRAGGVKEPTPTLLETATDAALESVMSNYKDLLGDHTRLVSGHFGIAWIRRLENLVKNGSEATLEACIDMSGARLQSKGGAPRTVGQDSNERAYFVKVDGVLKVTLLEHKWVETC